MNMYFETAGIGASPLLLLLVAFSISFFTSMGGVSGAFLLLPFQMSVLGFTSPAVSATNQVFNIMAVPAGLRRFSREGRMVWPLALAVMAGTVPGVAIGTIARVRYLPDATRFKVFAGCVLLVIGIRAVYDLFRRTEHCQRGVLAEGLFYKQVQGHDSGASIRSTPRVKVCGTTATRVEFEFLDHRFSCNMLGICALSLLVGAVGGAYGIGGGSIMAPFFISVLGLPVYAVAGAALAGTLVTSLTAVIFYHAIAPFYPELAVAPDWQLGALLGLGGIAGIWLGAKYQKHVPARVIRVMLAGIVLFVAGKYLSGLIH